MKRPKRRLLTRLTVILLSYGMTSSSVLVSVVAETQPPAQVTDDGNAVVLGQPAGEFGDEDDFVLLDDSQRVSVSVSVARKRPDGVVETTIAAQKVTVNKGDVALTAVLRILDGLRMQGGDYAYDPNAAQGQGSLTSIRLPNGEKQATVNGAKWGLLVNGQQVPTPLSKQPTTEGDVYTLLYVQTARSNEASVKASDVSPSALQIESPYAYAGGTTTAKTPVSVRVDWKTPITNDVDGASEPLWVDGDLYVAVADVTGDSTDSFAGANKLICVDAKSGLVRASVPLAGNALASSRMVYDNGRLYIALVDGRVQAVDVVTLRTLWVSARPNAAGTMSTLLKPWHDVPKKTSEKQTQSSHADALLLGTSFAESPLSQSGSALYVIDTATGKERDCLALSNAGPASTRWVDVLQVGKYAVAADSNGTIRTIASSEEDGAPSRLGAVVDSLELGTSLAGEFTPYGASSLIAMTRDGTLRLISVDEFGQMIETRRVHAVRKCAVSASVVDETAVVTGLDGEVAVLDLKSGQLIRHLEVLDAEKHADVFSPKALVSRAGQTSIAYLALDAPEGRTYWCDLAHGDIHLLFESQPNLNARAASPFVADDKGSLYYLNSYGELLCLKAQTAQTPPAKETDGAPPDEAALDTQSLASESDTSIVSAQAQDGAPDISLGNVGSKIMGRNSVATITLSQRVPSDLTSLEMWVDLPEVLEFYGTSGTVLVDGQDYSEAPISGQRVSIVPISGADAEALRSVSGDGSLPADGGVGKTVQLVFRVKAISDADLSAYVNGDVYMVPLHGESRFNGLDSRAYRSDEKYLQITGEEGDVIAPPTTTESMIEGTESDEQSLTTGPTESVDSNGTSNGTASPSGDTGQGTSANAPASSSSRDAEISLGSSSSVAGSSSQNATSTSSASEGPAKTGDTTFVPLGAVVAGAMSVGLGAFARLRSRERQ